MILASKKFSSFAYKDLNLKVSNSFRRKKDKTSKLIVPEKKRKRKRKRRKW